MWGHGHRGLFSIETMFDTNSRTFQMLQINIELTVVNASNTKRRCNVVLMRRRQWYSIKPTKKSESRNLKLQSICHIKNNPTIFKMVAKNAQNVVQTLLLLEKSQFSSSIYISALPKYIEFSTEL